MKDIIQVIERIELDLKALKEAILSNGEAKEKKVGYIVDSAALQRKIAKLLSDGSEITRQEVTAKFRTRLISREDILSALDDMESRGMVKKTVSQGVGRPLTTYKAA